ncbi:MAG: hypothetical protein AAGK14_02035 [Verrucomicrobiota bacterium]
MKLAAALFWLLLLIIPARGAGPTLEVALVYPDPTEDSREMTRQLEDGSQETLHVAKTPVVTEFEVESARRGLSANGNAAVDVTLTPAGSKKMLAATAANYGERFAIIVEGDVIIAPFIRGTFSSHFQISGGGMTDQEAEDLARKLDPSQRLLTLPAP